MMPPKRKPRVLFQNRIDNEEGEGGREVTTFVSSVVNWAIGQPIATTRVGGGAMEYYE